VGRREQAVGALLEALDAETPVRVGVDALAHASVPRRCAAQEHRALIARLAPSARIEETARIDAASPRSPTGAADGGLAALRRARDALEAGAPLVMMMDERETPRTTRMLVRGSYERRELGPIGASCRSSKTALSDRGMADSNIAGHDRPSPRPIGNPVASATGAH